MSTSHWVPGKVFFSKKKNFLYSLHFVCLLDASVTSCCGCSVAFTFVQRRHHCRQCGLLYCARCTNSRAPVLQYGFTKPVRVCRKCFDSLASNTDSVVVTAANAKNRNGHESIPKKPRIVYERLPESAGPADVPSDLRGQHFYFGNINRQSAERILADHDVGCCLFRRSSSDDGGFVISARRPNNKCSHFLLQVLPDGLYALQASDEVQTFRDALSAAAFLGFFALPPPASNGSDAAIVGSVPGADLLPVPMRTSGNAVIHEPSEEDEEQLVRKNVPDTLRQIAELGVPPNIASQALLQHSGNVERTLFTLRQSLSSDNIRKVENNNNNDDDTESED
jgi:hypothetical protein